jgi:hypothetical protein
MISQLTIPLHRTWGPRCLWLPQRHAKAHETQHDTGTSVGTMRCFWGQNMSTSNGT